VQSHKHATQQGYATQSEAEPDTPNPHTRRETGLNNLSQGPGEGQARLRVGVWPAARVATYAPDRHRDAHNIWIHRETEEKARQPEIKLGAIAQTHHTAKPCNAKRSRTRNPKPTDGERDRPRQPQPRAGRDHASGSGQRRASRRTPPTDTGTRCPGKGQR
jgi:hypothetical protein